RPPPAGFGTNAAAATERIDDPRARGAEADRARPLERGDRKRALRQRDNGEDTCRTRTDEARRARPRSGRRARVRIRPRRARGRITLDPAEEPRSSAQW